VGAVERRCGQYDDDIRFIYRELSWLRRGVTSLLSHFGIEPPGDEEE